MKFFSNKKSRLLWVLVMLLSFLWLFSCQNTSKQEVSKSPAAQAAKVETAKKSREAELTELSKKMLADARAAYLKRQPEATKKPAEKSQKTETELRKEMLDETVDLDARSEILKATEKHVSNAVERCADYKRKVYASPLLDPQVKDLLWGAAVVASEYCWQVDAPPAPAPIAKSTAKPQQKK